MTFEFTLATFQPSLVSKILEIDDQRQNHRVDARRGADVARDRLEVLKAHRSERSYKAAQERIELVEAAAVYRELKRELGVIDFGDQIDRALEVVDAVPRRGRRPPRAVPGRAARRVPGHERRPGPADGGAVRRTAIR